MGAIRVDSSVNSRGFMLLDSANRLDSCGFALLDLVIRPNLALVSRLNSPIRPNSRNFYVNLA